MSDPTIYTVAWICAIGTELVAAKQVLDETHHDTDQLPSDDDNTYILGKIGRHNIVITALPHGQYGLVSAAVVARDMVRSFTNIRFALMVGIGGGAPSQRHDVRLGDIVVSSPASGIGGVLQYDFGKTIQDESFEVTGHLNQSPQCLLRAIPHLEADYESDGNHIDAKIIHILAKKPRLRNKYGKPDPSTDRLYSSVYKHVGDKDQECAAACVDTELVVRSPRSEQDGPELHFGLIASANQLMKDAIIRDRLSSEKEVLCFEMEAAGLMNHFPCLVIRGICDYSDTHKNKIWQGYAAMAAAIYAKDLLCKIAPSKIKAEQRLVDVLSDVDTKLESIDSQVKTTHTEIKSIRLDKYSADLIQWLAPPDVSSNFNKAIQARHPGSGRRLLRSKTYTTWKTGRSSFLWLHGIPGCGKTILASTVIEDLQSSQSQSSLQMLLYFYFDFTDSRKQSFESTLRSLICQIYYQNDNAKKHIDSLYSSPYLRGKEQPRFESLQKIFTEMIDSLEEVWIVLDALDECTPRDELLAWLRSVNQNISIKINMHLLVTSRPEQDIESAIKYYASKEQIIAIQNDLLKADIRNYVQARVREHKGLSRWRGHKEIQDNIEASLLEKADGMFRWVSCQLDALEDCLERKSLLKALQDLPRTLDETYERILANIPLAHVHHTRRILQFLAYSERPLRLEEAVDAIAVDVGKDVAQGRRFDPNDRLPVPEEITRHCSSLVVLVSRQGRYGEKQEVTEIQLAHFSVKDYLTSNRLKAVTARYLHKMAAQSSIAKVCLAYLLECPKIESAKEITEVFPFAQYSARYWASHAVLCEHKSEYVFERAKELFSSRTQLKSWIHLYDPNNHSGLDFFILPRRKSYVPSALYYASLIGLPRCVEMLLNNGANIHAYEGFYGNALKAASFKGYQKIVRILLERGADVNAPGGLYGNALQAASSQGHRRIVQILLEKGVDVNAQGGLYGNALQVASERGYHKIVQILLEKGADVRTQIAHYNSAGWTAQRVYYELAQPPFDSGAHVNIQSKQYDNALWVALERIYHEFAQLSLNGGTGVNTQSGQYKYALQAMFKRGCQEIVQLLSNSGPDVYTHSEKYGNALRTVLERGYNEIANICIQTGHYVNALQTILEQGYQEIIRLLFLSRTNVYAENGQYGNALQAALERGHYQIIQLLLGNGADVNTQSGYYGNPLQVASFMGYLDIVRLLLDQGAEVNTKNGRFGNALQAASFRGYQEIVQLLLDNGADVNAQSGQFGNARYAALCQGHREIVQLLIDNGAESGVFGNALQTASFGVRQNRIFPVDDETRIAED